MPSVCVPIVGEVLYAATVIIGLLVVAAIALMVLVSRASNTCQKCDGNKS